MKVQKYYYFSLVSLLSWSRILIFPPRRAATTTSTSDTIVKSPNCDATCGNVKVPYHFGIDDRNCKDEDFLLSCIRSSPDSPPKLTIGNRIEVHNIHVENATMSVFIYNAYDCYDKQGHMVDRLDQDVTLGTNGPFTFSDAHNKLVIFGCDTMVFVSDAEEQRFGSGCISLCSENVDMAKESSCSGFGCSQTSVPKHLKTLEITLFSATKSNHTDVWEFNPCGFAFLVDQRSFDVSKMRLDYKPSQAEMISSSVLLDWAVGNETCDEALENTSSYVCGHNTDCYYSINGRGYQCRCSK
ncbi:Wall-associated receptor kinase, galacturonan-binding domain containing protein [Parasponia andersonii]|uniref:Wall-associated receptor kinase, galacturonan-binding domain containing protein n=1 Tax=Parasponia andersonii TaxID=3476 RepID=A0A2P5A7X9_PARAD|nr:Wall-associated receptor kinase, galacturonan-binding domain containing protein [Parasponia andersonii]